MVYYNNKQTTHQMLKKLATTVAIAATAFFSPVSAEEIVTIRGGLSLDREHTALVQAINAAGVNVQVNVGSNCKSGSDGVYYPNRAILAVCQDNAPQPHWSEVRWTANDLDTLRHEAVHLLQDCNAQDGPGGYTRLWFNSDEQLAEFVSKSLSERKVEWIIDTYAEAGADEFTIKAELEAFSIAATVSPGVLANAISTTCSAR